MIWLLLACTPTPQDSGPAPNSVELFCRDDEDNDGDGLTDCEDSDCAENPACYEAYCGDVRDNDLDGLTDCYDPDCWGRDNCTDVCDGCPEICDDNKDNDLDGPRDCDDPDCELDSACVEICDNGQDDDGDNKVDCLDPDCAGLQAPCIEVCDDGVDNDLDGATDCRDWDCIDEQASCIEICDDGVDNDADGLVDCEDGACADTCIEHSCDNGIDDDNNGRADCDDEDCWGLGACPNRAGLRVLGGRYRHHTYQDATFYMHATISQWWVDSASGVLVRGSDGVQSSCAWEANSVEAWEVFGVSYGHIWTRQHLALPGFSSTGACSSWGAPSQFTFSDVLSGDSLPERFDSSPNGFTLDGQWLARGLPFQDSLGRIEVRVLPSYTEPWVFWEEE
ncbi:MAG: hypothetical protein VX899_04655 [Myxococcota bacterium]|nr:hypothetical protein [Myxococcota bacterium]